MTTVPKHYDKAIQPIDFILANGMGFVEGNIVKYICRYELKGGVEDLEKIKHYCDILIDRVHDPKDHHHTCSSDATDRQ